MENWLSIILSTIEEARNAKQPMEILLEENDGLRKKLKVDFFDYNFELYISLVLMLENDDGNSVETSFDQFKVNEIINNVQLKSKYKEALEELSKELCNF